LKWLTLRFAPRGQGLRALQIGRNRGCLHCLRIALHNAQNALSLREGLAPRNLAFGTSSATAMHLQSSAIIRTLRTRRPALIKRTTSHLASGALLVFAFVRFHRSFNPCELVSMFTA
jgi:hypothetical protein